MMKGHSLQLMVCRQQSGGDRGDQKAQSHILDVAGSALNTKPHTLNRLTLNLIRPTVNFKFSAEPRLLEPDADSFYPKGLRPEMINVGLGPKCCNINGIWTENPTLFGPLGP